MKEVRNPVLDFRLKSVKWASTKRFLADTTGVDGSGHLKQCCSVGRNTTMFLSTPACKLYCWASVDLTVNQRIWPQVVYMCGIRQGAFPRGKWL